MFRESLEEIERLVNEIEKRDNKKEAHIDNTEKEIEDESGIYNKNLISNSIDIIEALHNKMVIISSELNRQDITKANDKLISE